MKTASIFVGLALALSACVVVDPEPKGCTGDGGSGGGSVGSGYDAGPDPEIATCADGKINHGETDVDCGGWQDGHSVNRCSACAAGKHCLADGDCLGGTCLSGGVCAGPCVPADACQIAYMDGPSCVRQAIPGCVLCIDGLNRHGTFHAPSEVCCTSCWDGSTCAAESNAAACGMGGVGCRSCGMDSQCVDGVCNP